jgi:hypothetical protein
MAGRQQAAKGLNRVDWSPLVPRFRKDLAKAGTDPVRPCNSFQHGNGPKHNCPLRWATL